MPRQSAIQPTFDEHCDDLIRLDWQMVLDGLLEKRTVTDKLLNISIKPYPGGHRFGNYHAPSGTCHKVELHSTTNTAIWLVAKFNQTWHCNQINLTTPQLVRIS